MRGLAVVHLAAVCRYTCTDLADTEVSPSPGPTDAKDIFLVSRRFESWLVRSWCCSVAAVSGCTSPGIAPSRVVACTARPWQHKLNHVLYNQSAMAPFRIVACTVLVLLRCISFRLHQPWNCAVSSRSLHGETLATQTQSCALQSICHGAVSNRGLYSLGVAPLQQFRVAPAREWLHRSGVVWGSVPVVSVYIFLGGPRGWVLSERLVSSKGGS